MKNMGRFFGLCILFIGVHIIFNLLFSEPMTAKSLGLDVALAFVIYLGIQLLKGRKAKVSE
ncbi:MAG: hypothetical protein Q4Q07_10535 [Tissierellia bacterium]|nr:hypothetical protein [Tissierellia bacterium]